MNRSCLNLFFLLCSLTFLGCRVFSVPEFRMPALLDVEVLRWEGSKPYVRTRATCYNQNKIGFRFKGGTVDVRLDTLLLGRAVIDTSFFVPAHSEFKVPAYLLLDLPYLSQHGLRLDSTVVHIDGRFKGTAMGISKTMHVVYKGTHNINLIMKPF